MIVAQRVLIFTGIFLITCTMAFGVGYAIFDEHQTLMGMGVQLATSFINAAYGDLDGAYQALDRFGQISREYRNEVHAHGHWGMLSLILIVLGLAFEQLPLSNKSAQHLAWLLALSAVSFPLGVLLQITDAVVVGKAFSIVGSLGMASGLLLSVWLLIRKSA